MVTKYHCLLAQFSVKVLDTSGTWINQFICNVQLLDKMEMKIASIVAIVAISLFVWVPRNFYV